MYRKSDDMSELEQEFELEMDDLEMDDSYETADDFEFETDDDSEFETDDFEFEDVEDSEFGDEESESEYEFESEYESEYEDEYESDLAEEFEMLGADKADYAERFFELSQREFESESEIDEAVNEILDDMQREYFSFGGLIKKAKGIGNVVKKGVALAKKAGINLPSLDALKSMLGPAADLLKGNLGSLIKPALKAALSAHPAGMAALPALKAIGFESSEDMGENREAWDNYVDVARESFEYLVSNAAPNVNQPIVASRLAANAFQAGLKKFGKRHHRRILPKGKQTRDHRKRNVRRILIAPGETIVIRRKP